MIVDINDLKSRFLSADKPTAADWEDFIDTLANYVGQLDGSQIIDGTIPINRIEDDPAGPHVGATDVTGKANWRDIVLSGDVVGTMQAALIKEDASVDANRPITGTKMVTGDLAVVKLAPSTIGGAILESVGGEATWVNGGFSMENVLFDAAPVTLLSRACFVNSLPDWTEYDVLTLLGRSGSGLTVVAAVVQITVYSVNTNLLDPVYSSLFARALGDTGSGLTMAMATGLQAGSGTTTIIPTDADGKFELKAVEDLPKSYGTITLLGYFYQML